MFDIFKSKSYADPQLGAFERKRGKWAGMIHMDAGKLPLLLSGNGDAPDTLSLAQAKELPQLFAALKPAIRDELFKHFEPYGETEEGAGLGIRNDDTLWSRVKLLGVVIEKDSIEIAIAADWDEEHTLGAIIKNGKLAELNGSIPSSF